MQAVRGDLRVGDFLDLPPEIRSPGQSLLVFVRHTGCPFAERDIKRARAWAAENPEVQVIVVTHGDEGLRDTWVADILSVVFMARQAWASALRLILWAFPRYWASCAYGERAPETEVHQEPTGSVRAFCYSRMASWSGGIFLNLPRASVCLKSLRAESSGSACRTVG